MKQQYWIVLTLIFALIIAVFAVINVDAVQVDFLFTTANAPLILVILFSSLLGALLMLGFSFTKYYQLQKELKELREENTNWREKDLFQEPVVDNGENENKENL